MHKEVPTISKIRGKLLSMEMKSFYPKGNWVKRKSRIKESVESLIKWVFEKTVRKSWQSR